MNDGHSGSGEAEGAAVSGEFEAICDPSKPPGFRAQLPALTSSLKASRSPPGGSSAAGCWSVVGAPPIQHLGSVRDARSRPTSPQLSISFARRAEFGIRGCAPSM